MLYLIFSSSVPFPLKNIPWHDKQPFALHFTTCKWSNQSPQSCVEPFSRKGLTILPCSCFLPLDSQRSLPFPGSGKLVSALELNCRTLSLQLNSLVCWRASLGIPFCIAKHPVCFQYAILSSNWGAVHLGKVASTTFSIRKMGRQMCRLPMGLHAELTGDQHPPAVPGSRPGLPGQSYHWFPGCSGRCR